MIVSLRELLEENNNITFIESIKSQMVDLYQQLSDCPYINTNIFLDIMKKNTIFVDINEKNEIMGTITIMIEQKVIHKGGKVAHIEDLVVDKKYRNKKIGKGLLQHAISFSKYHQCYKVILNCTDNVKEFYQKCGFLNKNIEMSLYF